VLKGGGCAAPIVGPLLSLTVPSNFASVKACGCRVCATNLRTPKPYFGVWNLGCPF